MDAQVRNKGKSKIKGATGEASAPEKWPLNGACVCVCVCI